MASRRAIALAIVSVGGWALAQPAAPTRMPPGRVAPGRPDSLRAPAVDPWARMAGSVAGPEAVLVVNGGAALVRGLAFSGGHALARDAAGRTAQVALERVEAAISTMPAGAPPFDAPADERRGVLTLADGQRFPGSLVLEGSTRERIVWRSSMFGVASAALSRVSSVRFEGGEGVKSGARATGELALADTVELTNGDRITGFVEAIGREVVVSGAGGGATSRFEVERVRAIELAAPAEASRGPLAWLSDGTVARVASIEPAAPEEGARGRARSEVVLTLPTGASGRTPLGAVLAVTDGLTRLSALSCAPRAGERIAPDQWQAREVELRAPARPSPFEAVGCADVLIPGQRVAAWSIPPGARALVGEVGLPSGAGVFAAAEVGVWIDGRPAARAGLRADAPAAGLAIPVPAGARELTVTVSPAGGGSVNALAELRQCVFVMGEQARERR